MVNPLPGATALKPGSATTPFFGARPVVLDDKGNEIEATACGGILAIADSWPGQMRTIYSDHDRSVSTYFELFKRYAFPATVAGAVPTGAAGSPCASTM